MRSDTRIFAPAARAVRMHEKAAFSLVEVALAIGLLAFCMISILGLLPVAMNVSAEAMDRNSKARMLQTIRADVLGADKNTLARERVFYFDLQGNLLARENPPSDLNGSHFEVTLNPVEPTSLPGGQQSAHLKTMELNILRQPQNSTVVSSLHIPEHGY